MKLLKIFLFTLLVFLVGNITSVNATDGTGSVVVTITPVIPTLTTSSVTSIAQTTATGGGNISSNGGATVTVSGCAWSTSINPTTANSKTTNGWAIGGPWSCSLTGLTAGTLYHVRAYATNSAGTAYGADVTFTTLKIPTVTTPTATSVTSTSATVGANVTSLGFPASISARGTCVSTGSPANCIAQGGTTTGVFTHSRTGLTPNTTYYVYGYATNATGTAYSPNTSFTTLPSPTIPTVTTPTVTSITQTSATVGANVTSLGIPASISARGTCVSTTGPANCVAQGGTTTGIFTQSRTGLIPNTTYNVFGYAINTTGTAYSPTFISFTTLPASCSSPCGTIASGNTCTAYLASSVNYPSSCTSQIRTCTNGTLSGTYTNASCSVASVLPTVTTTSPVTSIAQTTATGGGNVTSNGGATVSVSGLVWSTSINPTTANSKTTDGWAIGGPWTSGMTGLTANTLYHVRAYATNSAGTSYGADVTFTTLPPPTGTLTPATSSCTIALNGSSCNVTLDWTTTNPIGTSAVTASGMTNVDGNSGSQAFSVPYSSRTFYLYNNSIELASASATSSCVANTTWNGTICAINTNTLTINKVGTGTVTGAGTYNYGTPVTATQSAGTGYTFSGWSGDCNASGQVTMTANKTCTATFITNNYTVSTSAGAGGSISPTSKTVNHGDNTTFTVAPNSGYSIGSVSGCGGTLSGSTYTTGAITSACTVSATFTTVTISVNASPTSYFTIPSTNVSFAYTSSTNLGSTECRLLDYASSPVTSYQASSPIIYPSNGSAGEYGYYVQCRNTTHTTVTATSALITVTVVTVTVSASTPYNVAPNSSVNFTYTPNTNSGTTECLLLDSVSTPLTSYQLASPIVYTIPDSIGSYGYYVKCRNTTTTTAIANSNLITVNTNCASGTSWNGSACVAPSGNITASNCTIVSGGSSCNSNLIWDTTYPIGTSAVTTPTSITVANANSSTGTLYPVPNPNSTRTFYLYNNSNLLSQATATATCISGTIWNPTTAKCESSTGTLTASGCIIAVGNNSCDTTLIWDTLNPLDGVTSVVKTPTPSGSTVATANSSTGTPYVVPYNSRTFVLVHNGVTLASSTPISACAQKTTWNGSICELNAPEINSFTADPSTIFEGKSSNLTWESDPDLVTSCTGTGFDTGGLISGSVKVSPVVTTTYSLTCSRVGYPSVAQTAVVKVIVLTIKEQ